MNHPFSRFIHCAPLPVIRLELARALRDGDADRAAVLADYFRGQEPVSVDNDTGESE